MHEPLSALLVQLYKKIHSLVVTNMLYCLLLGHVHVKPTYGESFCFDELGAYKKRKLLRLLASVVILFHVYGDEELS